MQIIAVRFKDPYNFDVCQHIKEHIDRDQLQEAADHDPSRRKYTNYQIGRMFQCVKCDIQDSKYIPTINLYCTVYELATLQLSLFFYLFVGALYRYWESRRRIVNDSRPDRADAVEQNKKNARRKSHQTRVCYFCVN